MSEETDERAPDCSRENRGDQPVPPVSTVQSVQSALLVQSSQSEGAP